MKQQSDFDLNDNFEDLGYAPKIKNTPKRQKPSGSRPTRAPRAAQKPALTGQTDREAEFTFSYHASRHEQVWIQDSLGRFYEEHWLDDVLRMLKGGKEATVYLCTANPDLQADFIAAKVYRPRQFRNLRKDHIYREGRDNLDANGNIVTDDGMLHAMRKRTTYGLELLHTSWIEHEFQTLTRLHDAGVDIPTPFVCGNNAILMQYFGDAVNPAPTLNSVDLTPREARPLFERVLHNVEVMLANKCIHGDLSAYNILFWEGEIVLIDFPQAVRPEQNANTFRIFERDITRICEYFQAQGVPSNPRELAAKLWSGFQYPLNAALDPAYLDDESEEDRALWIHAQQK